jgi:predicted nucleic-acid-binding Zn-ribbon protein
MSKGFSCPKCGDNIPYGEKIMFNVLEQLGLEFQIQLNKTTCIWCKDFRYDFNFELNGEQILIETHGNQHYEKSFSTIEGAKSLEEEIENDRMKKELAIKNGIKPENYIVINCKESTLKWIKDNDEGILNSRLNELFDLSKISWTKVEEFALSSRVKEACDIKRNNPNLSTGDIGVLMKLSNDTIREYLKQGEALGWSEYNSKLELVKSQFKKGNIPHNIKQVEVFKDGISKGIYPSARYIDTNSEQLFGIKLDFRSISAVCLGRTKQHNGFIFKFVNEDLKVAN